MDDFLTVAVVGATGAVGAEFLRLFDERAFPVGKIKLLASKRSAGKTLVFQGRDIVIEELTSQSFEGVDIAFFSAGASRSREFAPQAIKSGAIVIDNSSAFRMDEDVPLVVPEINGHLISKDSTLISVPNCSAIILLMAVYPISKLGKLDRLIVSTYQSASGGGAAMMERLIEETRRVVDPGGEHQKMSDAAAALNLPHYAFNLFSHNTAIGDDGFNEEEQKVVAESRKILSRPDLKINVTCIRVPVLRAHSESVTLEFEGATPSLAAVKKALEDFEGVRLVDDRTANNFPTPVMASGQGDVLVGRLREDKSHPSSLSMFIAGDQLLKGAALNAVQIAENWLLKVKLAEKATARV